MFGQRASSHTVCRPSSRIKPFSRRYPGDPGARTFSQSGLGARGSTADRGITRAISPLLYRPDVAGPQGRRVTEVVKTAAALGVPPTFNAASYFVDRHLREGRGGKIAIECGDERVSYAELHERVNRFGSALRRKY